jgi:hypothetical protein
MFFIFIGELYKLSRCCYEKQNMKSIKILFSIGLTLLSLLSHFNLRAQVSRAQLPGFLADSYIGANIGYIHYPFSALQLEPGFQAESIRIPHLAVQIFLVGHHFNDWLSGQLTYLRPVNWVEYNSINGDQHKHYVHMNLAGLTLTARQMILKKISVFGEVGLNIVTRNGTKFNELVFVEDANIASLLLGTGFHYHLNKLWDLKASMTYTTGNRKERQPHTFFYSAGFNYNFKPLPADRVAKNSNTRYKFPRNIIQLGYSTNRFSYGANNFVSKGAIPIFWGGEAEVKQGFSLHYTRNIFHGRKLFSLDWGASFSYWQSNKEADHFFTLSVFPLFRMTFLHTKPADLYFYYSVAGPSFISKTNIDSINTGKHFTFQDLMGIGTFAGKNRQINAEVRIGHYSNGNIFSDNEGVKIPLTFNIGYTF